MEDRSQLFRYPGPKPFVFDESHLFFGREADKERLYNFVLLRKISVLYGKSGLGKTSLLNVGIIPKLEETQDCKTSLIRFTNWQAESAEPIYEKFIRSVFPDPPSPSFLDRITTEDQSFWFRFKQAQAASPNHKRPVTIVLDQFEELFTYPEEEVRAFGQELSLLLSNNQPTAFRQAFRRAMKADDSLLTDEELDLVYEPINLKIIISIRSDRLNLLNRLAPSIPDILKNCYELLPLSRDQAREAIVKPALLPGDYASPAFELDRLTLDRIMDSLTNQGASEIESFHLQLICQDIEQIAIRVQEKLASHVDARVLLLPLSEDNFSLEEVIQKFYLKVIEKLPEDQQLQVRRLLEEGLVFEDKHYQRRIALYEGQIAQQFEIHKAVLDELVREHIIRCDQSTGGFYYELSHDSFVQPVLELKQQRLRAEQREAARRRFEKEEEERRSMDNYRITRELRKVNEEQQKLIRRETRKRGVDIMLERMRAQGSKRIVIMILVQLAWILVVVALISWAVINVRKTNRSEQTIEQVLEDLQVLERKWPANPTDSSQQEIRRELEEILDKYEPKRPD